MQKFTIITGGSSGLGLHFAKAIYVHGGYSIVLACRNENKARLAVEEVQKCAIDDARKSEHRHLDLTSGESIKQFLNEFSNICQPGDLHLLVNNAGIMNHPPQVTKSGFEIHFASNYLGHFVLTNLLMKYMADNGRILNVSSAYYQKANGIPIDDISLRSSNIYSPINYYSISKLASILHTVALNLHLSAEKSNIKAVAIRPGFIRGTDLGRHTSYLLRFLAAPMIWFFSKNLDQGISGILHCSLCAAEQLKSGHLYFGEKIVEYNQELINIDIAENLWERSLKFQKLMLECD